MIEHFKEDDIRNSLKDRLKAAGCSVFKEVNRIDLLAIKNGKNYGFELKSTSGDCHKALGQAVGNSKCVDFSYVVLPEKIVNEDFLQTLQMTGIGLVVVDKYFSFKLKRESQEFYPTKIPIISKKKLKLNLAEESPTRPTRSGFRSKVKKKNSWKRRFSLSLQDF